MSRKRTRKHGTRVKKTKGAFGKPKIFRTKTWNKPTVELDALDEKKSFIGKLKDWFKKKNRTII